MKQAEVESKLNELLVWKERQEQQAAERLAEMHNAILEVLAARHATVTEVQTVMEMIKFVSTQGFVEAHQPIEKANTAVKTMIPVPASDIV
jgi:septum formation topological specificity factor MinE